MLEHIDRYGPVEPYFNFGSNGPESLEHLFLNSPLLIFMSAALLAVLPVLAVIFTPIQFQYEYRKSRRSIRQSAPHLNLASFSREHSSKKISKTEVDDVRRTPLVIFRNFLLNRVRKICTKLGMTLQKN